MGKPKSSFTPSSLGERLTQVDGSCYSAATLSREEMGLWRIFSTRARKLSTRAENRTILGLRDARTFTLCARLVSPSLAPNMFSTSSSLTQSTSRNQDASLLSSKGRNPRTHHTCRLVDRGLQSKERGRTKSRLEIRAALECVRQKQKATLHDAAWLRVEQKLQTSGPCWTWCP